MLTGEKGNVQNPSSTLSWKNLLFSFHGRISRKQFWMTAPILWIISLVGLVLGALFLVGNDPLFFNDIMAGVLMPDSFDNAAFSERFWNPVRLGLAVVITCYFIIITWIAYAIIVKRRHDRNKGGWGALWLLFVPIFNGIGDWSQQTRHLSYAAYETVDAFQVSFLSYTASFGPYSLYALMGWSMAWIIAVWFLADLGLCKGTSASNRFGEIP